MFKRVRNILLQRGFETAVGVGAEAAAQATTKTFVQVFEIALPATVYVRASQVDVSVVYVPGTKVELSANLRASFGWDFVTEQDANGIYIVAKRKPIVGTVSTAKFTITMPPNVNFVCHLTPGALSFKNIDGKVSIPAVVELPVNGSRESYPR
jgi:hypothetical protein